MLTYGSVCSGIEAASAAWEPLGWKARFFSEIEEFPSAVLAHHYGSNMPGEPLARNGVPNYGDFTAIPGDAGPVDILVGGTPCQSFSVAGKRLGLDDPRGNLALEYVRLAKRLGARWVVWENVPGVLSSADGRDFADFLGFLAGRDIGLPRRGGWKNAGIVAGTASSYGLAWRVLDAQFVRVDGYARAVPQRRRRVFVVGYLGDWRRAAAILFEPESMQGHPAPRREAGKRAAPTIASRTTGGGGLGTDFDLDGGLLAFGGGNRSGPLDVSTALTAHGVRQDFEVETFIASVASTLPAGGNSTGGDRQPGTSAETAASMLVAHTLLAKENDSHAADMDTYVAHSLRGEGFDASEDGTGRGTPIVPVAFDWYSSESQSMPIDDGLSPPLKTTMQPAVFTLAVRGREGGRDLEYRDDGTANAVLTPSGGRAGIGVGAVAYSAMPMNSGKSFTVRETDVAHPIMAGGQMHGDQGGDIVRQGYAVRRLTPVECARLQGFADDRCRIAWKGKPPEACPDGPQYKAYGNSMAVNVMRWIGQRIDLMEQLDRAGRLA